MRDFHLFFLKDMFFMTGVLFRYPCFCFAGGLIISALGLRILFNYECNVGSSAPIAASYVGIDPKRC